VSISRQEVEQGILETLARHAVTKGLTNSELLKKCGSAMHRSVAAFFKRKQAGTEDIKDLLYTLWQQGLVFFQPPNRGQRVGRVWDMNAGLNAFPPSPSLTQPRDRAEESPKVGQQALKAAYAKFVPEHLGGFVPIFKVRRELGWPRQVLDEMLQDLNERHDPVVELHTADPADLTEEEKRDSLLQGNRLLVRMRWREP